MKRPLHVLLYAESGAGKSSFARTFPKPMLVFCFDYTGKEEVYTRTRIKNPNGPGTVEVPAGDIVLNMEGVDVFSKKDKSLLTRIERYNDPLDTSKMRTDSAYAKFQKRILRFHEDLYKWQTVVFDSLRFYAWSVRKHDMLVVNPKTSDGWSPYRAATNAVEDLIWRTGGWPVNVVMITHTDADKAQGDSGIMKYKPLLPGEQMLRDIGGAFTEYYHPFKKVSEDGRSDEYLIQTRGDRLWTANTAIGAPNPCKPHYRELWANYQEPEKLEVRGTGTGSESDGNQPASVLEEGSTSSAEEG